MTKCSGGLLCVTIILLLSFSFSTASAQGDYLKPGEDGWDINLFGSSGKHNSGFGARIGYSARGVVDFGFSYGNIDGEDLYSPGVTLHLLKQDYINFPLNFSLAASTTSDNINGLFSDNYSSFTPVLFSNLKTSERITLQPSFQVAFLKYNTKHSSEGRTAYGLGLSYFAELKSRDVIKIESVFALQRIYGNYEGSFGSSLGVLFRVEKKKDDY